MKPEQIIYIYRDRLGREWSVKKESLPKKKGEYVYWIGECKEDAIRKLNKKDILEYIKSFK